MADIHDRPHQSETMSRKFRREKRAQFKEVLKAMRKLRFGCALMPREAGVRVSRSMQELEQAHKECLEWWKNF